ncbi:MAG: aminopeptidase [Candidatus Bathyarchaeota archaeon]|nr:aminopeptidase [Candidatus Bathyarchaeota archaeon]
MVEKEEIAQAVVDMFRVNMGLKSAEKVLVVTDVLTIEEWVEYDREKLTDFAERSILAKIVSEIAKEKFSDCPVEFFSYPSVRKHGSEPGKEVEERMKAADVVIAITTYSLTHTEARENATRKGTRIASMPTFLVEMFYPGGPMAADYSEIEEETEKIAKAITESKEAVVTSPEGTSLKLSIRGRKGEVDAGIFSEKGAWGNLPSGEAYCAPVEGTGEGRLVVETSWYPSLEENMTLVFEKGNVVEVIGGGKVGDELRSLLAFDKNEEPYISRRNLAELGVGTNPNARRPDNVLEAEKIKGTVHVAIGDSSHMGGKVSADLHQDFVVPRPMLILDGETIMKDGKLLI